MKKNCAIVFGITKSLDFALANVLIGLKKHNKKFWDDIIVFHDGLSNTTIENLNKIIKIEPVLYDENKIKGKIDEDLIKNYSLLTLARFECFDLLKKYKKVMWHDVDILIQKDISELLDYTEKTGISMTVGEGFFNEQNFFGIMEGYELLKPLYNAGIFVIGENLKNHEEFTNECYKLFNENAPKLRYLDQSVLNMLIEDYKIDVNPLPLIEYCCHPKVEKYKSAKIIHAYGTSKFWNSYELKKQFPEWDENNKQWEKINNKKSYEILPKISVIMSVYDRIDFLKESIESILNQTFKDFELIIVLEYTKEQKNIEKYINEFNDDRIVVIKNTENLGFAESLNVAIRNSKGKYIARMDDDDISLHNRLEIQYNYLEEHIDVDLVGSYMKVFMNNNDFWPIPCNYEELKVRALTSTPLYHPSVMMRKNVIVENNYYYSKEHLTEDYELWCRIIDKVKIENIPIILVRYRASNQNATITKKLAVQKCHDEIVQRNFKENLNIELNFDEITLLQNESILNQTYNSEKLRELRNNCIKRIIESNRKLKKYDEYLLCQYFNNFDYYKNKPKKLNLKSMIKKYILTPIYNPIRFRLKKLIEESLMEHNNKLSQIDCRLSVIEEKIEKNIKK